MHAGYSECFSNSIQPKNHYKWSKNCHIICSSFYPKIHYFLIRSIQRTLYFHSYVSEGFVYYNISRVFAFSTLSEGENGIWIQNVLSFFAVLLNRNLGKKKVSAVFVTDSRLNATKSARGLLHWKLKAHLRKNRERLLNNYGC